MPVYLTPPPGNPLTRALAAVVAALFLIGAFMIGMVAFLVALGISLIAGLWFWVKNWRALSQVAKQTRAAGASRGAEHSGRPDSRGNDAIEGEYTVVSRDDEHSR